jgi:excisionase family DNA binding protein
MTNAKTLTVRQAALRLGNTQKYIRDLLYEQKLPGAQKKGREWLIPLTAIEERLRERDEREALNG